jgi:hypothetical protein
MSEAVVLDFAAPEPEPTPAHRRIRLASGALAWLFTALLVLSGLLFALLGAAFFIPALGRYIGIGPTGMLLTSLPRPPPPYIPVSSLPLLQRLAHLPVGLIDFAPVLAIFLGLRRLFGLYAKGVVFGAENARCFRWIGMALIANAVAPGLGVLFLTSLHMAVDHQWMHASSLQELVLGAIVYVIALVMQVGHELEEERGQFI